MCFWLESPNIVDNSICILCQPKPFIFTWYVNDTEMLPSVYLHDPFPHAETYTEQKLASLPIFLFHSIKKTQLCLWISYSKITRSPANETQSHIEGDTDGEVEFRPQKCRGWICAAIQQHSSVTPKEKKSSEQICRIPLLFPPTPQTVKLSPCEGWVMKQALKQFVLSSARQWEYFWE